MSDSQHNARSYVLHEATLLQLKKLSPNVAVLPWGAEEAHNYHLPHGTDVVAATAIAETVVARANAGGARCLVLPAVPFGNDNLQLSQVATITMRTSTQHAVLYDVADSLARQGIDRLVIFNFHGGNDFKQLIRDVMLNLPIFIVQINLYEVAPESNKVLAVPGGDHANEMETSLLLHLKPQWVAPLETAGDGQTTPSKLPALSGTAGVWCPRDWASLTQDTGVGNPKAATAQKGEHIFQAIVEKVVPILVELSAAQRGDFPFVIRNR
jgi:creatinine amidohydrolase